MHLVFMCLVKEKKGLCHLGITTGASVPEISLAFLSQHYNQQD